MLYELLYFIKNIFMKKEVMNNIYLYTPCFILNTFLSKWLAFLHLTWSLFVIYVTWIKIFTKIIFFMLEISIQQSILILRLEKILCPKNVTVMQTVLFPCKISTVLYNLQTRNIKNSMILYASDKIQFLSWI